MKKEKHSSGNNTKRIVTGWTTAFATLMIFTAVTAMLIDNNTIKENGTRYATALIVLMSSLAGSLTASGKLSNRNIKSSLMFAGAYWLSLLAVTALLFEGRYNGIAVTLLLILAGSLLPVILCKKKYNRPYSVKKQCRNR